MLEAMACTVIVKDWADRLSVYAFQMKYSAAGSGPILKNSYNRFVLNPSTIVLFKGPSKLVITNLLIDGLFTANSS